MNIESAIGFAIGWSSGRRREESDRIIAAIQGKPTDPVPTRSLCEADFLLGDGQDCIAPPKRDSSTLWCWIIGLSLAGLYLLTI